MLHDLKKKNPPADLDFQDEVGSTALHIAVANKDIEVTKLLLGRDADLFMTDDNGLTALHVAVAQSSVDLAQLICLPLFDRHTQQCQSRQKRSLRWSPLRMTKPTHIRGPPLLHHQSHSSMHNRSVS